MLLTAIKYLLAIILFPFTLWNLCFLKKHKTPPPGKTIHTNHSDVHIIESGKGPVTVILEAGLGSISIDWYSVQPEISKYAKVISYDRGDYGWSRTKRKTLTSIDTVEDLKEVLNTLNVQPPYILVGHSFGGLSMRLFASLYPDDVAGLVLVDAVHEQQYVLNKSNKKRINNFKRVVTFGYITCLTGLPRLLKQKVGRKFLSKEFDIHLKYVGYTLGAYKSIYREYRDSHFSANQVMSAKPLRDNLPVIIISSNNPSEQWKIQQQLLNRINNNTVHIQTDFGHSIHLEAPKVVIESIIKMVSTTRSKEKIVRFL